MLNRLAPLVPIALLTLLVGCAAQAPVSQQQVLDPVTAVQPHQSPSKASLVFEDEIATEDELAQFDGSKAYSLPILADSILERGKSLIGTRYRFGGTDKASGFDCSGFIGYLFREEAGMKRNKLKPGDLLFFSTNGRGRVSHAGIYLGDDQFIHSSSRRSGGVRVDSLGDSYWSKTFIEAKRALAMAPATMISSK
ncbi:peptidase P60 [Pseudomonas putida]|nr:peptidase P60 [Pseudomonas putida]